MSGSRWLSPGPNRPSGFVLTTVLGIGGAFLATFLGQPVGWYRADRGAGFIAATIGAVAVLFIRNRLVASGGVGDPAIQALSQQTRVEESELLREPSESLPQLVDRLTPRGHVPTAEEAARL